MAKMTTKIATQYCERIEALQEEISKVRAEIVQTYSSSDENVINDALKARAAAREEEWNGSALLESFDVEDDE
jgi:uncharacterized protein (UPF0335 family)